MNIAKFVGVWGAANVGKSTLLGMCEQYLLHQMAQIEAISLHSDNIADRDFVSIVLYKELVIGFATSGDNANEVQWCMETLESICKKSHIDIVFFATRTKGATCKL